MMQVVEGSQAPTGRSRASKLRATQVDGLIDVATAVSSALDLDDVLERAVRSLIGVMRVTSGAVYFIDRERQKIIGRNEIGFERGLQPGIDIHDLDDAESFVGRALQSPDPLIFDAGDDDLGYSSITEEEIDCIVPERVQTAIAARIESKTDLYGVLVLCSQGVRRVFASDDLAFVQTAAGQIAVAVERARLYEALRFQAVASSTLHKAAEKLGMRCDGLDDLHQILDLACMNLEIDQLRITLRSSGDEETTVISSRRFEGGDTDQLTSIGLSVGGLEFGTLSASGFVKQQQIALLRSLADLISMAILNRKLYDEARQAAVVEERNRFARDIHDGLLQRFYSILINLRPIRDGRAQAEHVQRLVEKAWDQAREGLSEGRTAIHELRGGGEELPSLSGMVYVVVADFRQQAEIACDIRIEGNEQEMSESARRAILLSLQELLRNVQRHACASHVQVLLAFREDLIELSVVDDGVGLSGSSHGSNDSFGLAGVRERLLSIGGRLEVRELERSGTEAKIIAGLHER